MKSSKHDFSKHHFYQSAKSREVIAPKAVSKSGERTRAHEIRRQEERYARERANHGLDENRKPSEIERHSQAAHERSLRERAAREKDRLCERCSEPIGQAGAKKQRPMYSEDE